jgi:hypothetical protein
MAKTGTVRKLVIEGITFLVAADADFSEIITEFENTLIANTGAAILKQEKRTQDVSDVVLITNGNQREQLASFADGGDTLAMSYTNRAGDVYRYTGQINVDNNQTMESRTTIGVLPYSKRTANLA